MRRFVTFGPARIDRSEVLKAGVSSPSRTRGMVMMVVGLLMVLATVLIIVLTGDPLPTALGVIGIVFAAVGSRQRRLG